MTKKLSFASRVFLPWWKPVIYWAVSILVTIAGIFSDFEWAGSAGAICFMLSAIGLIVSAIVQWSRSRWLAGFASAALGVGSIVLSIILIIAAWTLSNLDSEDHWADNLKIPAGVALDEPAPFNFGQGSDSLKERLPSFTDFRLHEGFQPGIYSYEAFVQQIASGEVYLKAYELTGCDPLSVGSLREASRMKVENHRDSIVRFGMQHDDFFTIYEGDWGKFYAARFELWYAPAAGGPERKLKEKYYRIQGWMR